MPGLIRQADSRVSPPAPVEAKGAPLSGRTASGRPKPGNARSNSGLASSCRVLPVADRLIR